MQEKVRTKYHPSLSFPIRPPTRHLSNLNSALLFLNVAQEEFSSNSLYWCDIDIIRYLLTQTRDAIQAEHDKGPNLASALLRDSVLEESTSIRWNRLTIANDADLVQQTEALQSAGIKCIVGNHKVLERGKLGTLVVGAIEVLLARRCLHRNASAEKQMHHLGR